MNIITKWLSQCSNCFFNNRNFTNDNYSQLSNYNINIYNLAKYCLHITNKKDSICYKCFLEFFHYDRFIIHHLFFYLNQQQTNYVHIKQFNLFAQCIINWHEFINHMDFILLLFHIILSKNNKILNNLLQQQQQDDDDNILEKTSINSILLYELIKDAFFFTAIQSNVQTNLTNSSQLKF
ncbi:unnamed protein product [Rotaria sordida]|uniref:Uncharacterized protein n=1 Tax=Rotaria sordida TaxID=392033 RepID=A0A815GKI1_9BILA|nr:unnamed protein product [Rotaria sordida]CAF3860999.1 unnamed protein product [Rotaria sordida]